jgi:cytochrome c oxidase assembly factor CtaG
MDPVITLAVAIYAVLAVVHLAAVWRAIKRPQAATGLRGTDEAAAFRNGRIRDAALVQGGLLIALLALVSPLAYWSGVYLWVKALQDIVLAFIAPALIVVGRPWTVLPGVPARRLNAGRDERARLGAANSPSGDDLPEVETAWSRVGPVLAVVLFNAAWLGWHLPAAFDLAKTDTAVRLAQQASYLGFGYWFWLQVAGRQRYGRWQAPLRRLGFVIATVACATVVGMALVFGAHVDYPVYQNSAHHIMTVLDDQQLSGAVLWMGNLPSLVTAGVALLNAWLNQEESATPADPGVLFKPRTTGWPARPRIR